VTPLPALQTESGVPQAASGLTRTFCLFRLVLLYSLLLVEEAYRSVAEIRNCGSVCLVSELRSMSVKIRDLFCAAVRGASPVTQVCSRRLIHEPLVEALDGLCRRDLRQPAVSICPSRIWYIPPSSYCSASSFLCLATHSDPRDLIP
jgi:hypothetical protein